MQNEVVWPGEDKIPEVCSTWMLVALLSWPFVIR